MTTIQKNLNQVLSELKGSKAKLVAISKFHSIEAIKKAYDGGQRVFGESHVQELNVKQPALPTDIEWHFIGHLQSNKVKYIAPYIKLIHSVDSLKLLNEINKQAEMIERTIDCLLQVHIAKEEAKYGFLPEELTEVMNMNEYKKLQYIRIRGLMCMATNTDDETQIRKEFHTAKQLFDQIKNQFYPIENSFSELSMGMSNDYHIAIEEGSTLIRVGSKIFGERNYEI